MDEFGDFVAISAEPSLGLVEASVGAPGDEFAQRLRLDRVCVCARQICRRGRGSGDEADSFAKTGEDHLLANEVRVPGVAELEYVDPAGGAASLSLGRKPGDSHRENQRVVTTRESGGEHRIGPVTRSTPPRACQCDDVDRPCPVGFDPALDDGALEARGNINQHNGGPIGPLPGGRVGDGKGWVAEHAMPFYGKVSPGCVAESSCMRAVVQRVSRASVIVDGAVVGAIQNGLCVLLGVGVDDTETDATAIADKICGLRIFADAEGLMNLAVADVGGSILIVSQFTLYADMHKGRRPSFVMAAPPEHAEPLVAAVVARMMMLGIEVATGRFRASMEVELVNQGPVTIIVETRAGKII